MLFIGKTTRIIGAPSILYQMRSVAGLFGENSIRGMLFVSRVLFLGIASHIIDI